MYFRTLSSLDLNAEQVEVVQRNATSLLMLHERIGIMLEDVQEELKWKEYNEGDGRLTLAAGRIASIFVNEVSCIIN